MEQADRTGLEDLALRLVRNDAEAEDLVQESLLVAARSPEMGRRLNIPWLRGVLRMKARESTRRDQRRQAYEAAARPPAAPDDPALIAAQSESESMLRRAVAELGEPYRSTIEARYFGGHSAIQVAELLGISTETVRTREKRGVKCLRRILDRKVAGGRAVWVGSLSAFAGVNPSRDVLATSSMAGSGFAAAALCLVATSTWAVLTWDPFGEEVDASSRSQLAELGVPSMPTEADGADGAGTASRASRGDARSSAASRPSIKTEGYRPPRVAPEPGASKHPPLDAAVREVHLRAGEGFLFESEEITKDPEVANIHWVDSGSVPQAISVQSFGPHLACMDLLRSDCPDFRSPEALLRALACIRIPRLMLVDGFRTNYANPASFVFVVRLNGERWAACCVRPDEPSLRSGVAAGLTLCYRLAGPDGRLHDCDRAKVLSPAEVDLDRLRLWDLKLETRRAVEDMNHADRLRARLAELDARARDLARTIELRRGPGWQVAALLHHEFAKPAGLRQASNWSQFNLTTGSRMRGRWDIAFRGQPAQIEASSDEFDRSEIRELGPYLDGSERDLNIKEAIPQPAVLPTLHRIYAVRALNEPSHQLHLLVVEELTNQESLIFSWRSVEFDVSSAEDSFATAASGARPAVLLQVRTAGKPGVKGRASLSEAHGRPRGARSDHPLRFGSPLGHNEYCRHFVKAPEIPEGQAFRVQSVAYRYRMTPGIATRRSLEFCVGAFPIAHVSSRRVRDGFAREWSLFRGAVEVAMSSAWHSRTAEVHIDLLPGDLRHVWVEVGPSTECEIELRGRLIDAKQARNRGAAKDGERLLRRLVDHAQRGRPAKKALQSRYRATLAAALPYTSPGGWRRELEILAGVATPPKQVR